MYPSMAVFEVKRLLFYSKYLLVVLVIKVYLGLLKANLVYWVSEGMGCLKLRVGLTVKHYGIHRFVQNSNQKENLRGIFIIVLPKVAQMLFWVSKRVEICFKLTKKNKWSWNWTLYFLLKWTMAFLDWVLLGHFCNNSTSQLCVLYYQNIS